MERMKLQCFGVTSEEIRYRRIGNERRIPFAFWPSSQKCLHRTLLIVLYRSKQLYWLKRSKKTKKRREALLFMPSLTTWRVFFLLNVKAAFVLFPLSLGWYWLRPEASSCTIAFHWTEKKEAETPSLLLILWQYPKKSQFSRERLQCSGWFGMPKSVVSPTLMLT